MSNQKILCIDDSVNLLQVLKARFQLEMENMEVLTTTDGEEGIRLAQTEKPNLIILDVTMPKISGIEVLKQLKSENETCTIPIIILTSRGPEERDMFIKLGAADYIPSPFETDDLIKRVKELLAGGK